MHPDMRLSTMTAYFSRNFTRLALVLAVGSQVAAQHSLFAVETVAPPTPKVVVKTAPAASFAWQDAAGDHLDLLYRGKPALRYMYHPIDESTPEARAATFKPYHHVFSPTGGVQLTNGAGAKLFPHHHGVFFGFHKITYHGDKLCDVWHCTGNNTDGTFTQHDKELERSVDATGGKHVAAISWHGLKGELFANERRTMALHRRTHHEVEGWQIDFASHLETADGQPIHLDGDPQHAGFHFRANPHVADITAKKTYYLRTDGKGKLDETRNWDHDHLNAPGNAECTNRPWDACSFIIGATRYTVLYIDHDANPKPARSSERDYGRFGTYFVTDVTKVKPLDVKYRLWVQEGEMTVEQCQALHAEFAAAK